MLRSPTGYVQILCCLLHQATDTLNQILLCIGEAETDTIADRLPEVVKELSRLNANLERIAAERHRLIGADGNP